MQIRVWRELLKSTIDYIVDKFEAGVAGKPSVVVLKIGDYTYFCN